MPVKEFMCIPGQNSKFNRPLDEQINEWEEKMLKEDKEFGSDSSSFCISGITYTSCSTVARLDVDVKNKSGNVEKKEATILNIVRSALVSFHENPEMTKHRKEKFLREEKVGVKEGEIPKPNNFPLQESRA